MEACRCEWETHGHDKGGCSNPATDTGLCKECEERKAADEAMLAIRQWTEPPPRRVLSPSQLFQFAFGMPEVLKGAPAPSATLVAATILIPERTTSEGTLIHATTLLFDDIVRELGKDWSRVLDHSSDQWEEIVVGYFHRIHYEVTHTPRSGDLGRDLIARKNGFGAVKILGSVKRYAPGRLVPAAEVRELMGVLDLDKGASKAMLFTTSDFAPRLLDDKGIADSIPGRLELINGVRLQGMLKGLDGD